MRLEVPMIPGSKEHKKATRSERLSAALRENLKRRKAQARGRAQGEDAREVAPPGAADAAATPDFRRNRGRE
jgi:hypothetical protein